MITVGKDELQAMIDEDHGCQLHCQFCNTEYNFSEDELKEIIERFKIELILYVNLLLTSELIEVLFIF